MNETVAPPVVQFVLDLWQTSNLVAEWDLVSAVRTAAVAFSLEETDVYTALLEHDDSSLINAVARDGTDPATHAKCARHPDPFVREMCALNTSVSAEILAQLAGDTQLVRWRVAGNRSANHATLQLLAKEPGPVGFTAQTRLSEDVHCI